MPKRTPKFTADAIRLYQAGWSIAETARMLDAPLPTVRDHLYRSGIKMRPRSYANNNLSHKEWEITIRLYVEERLSAAEIGRLLGVRPTTVYGRLVKAGVPRRSRAEAIKLHCDKHDDPVERSERALRSAITQGMKPPLSEEQAREAIRLYWDGEMNLLEVANALGRTGSDPSKRHAIKVALFKYGSRTRTFNEVQRLRVDKGQHNNFELREAA